MSAKQISSERLAALIVDALVSAGIVDSTETERAKKIAAEEIDARKAVRDY